MPTVKTRCMFCPMQDSFYLKESPRSDKATWGRDSILWLEFDPELSRGLCGRGNYCQELSSHKDRAFRAKMGANYLPAEKVAKALSEALRAESGERTAILLDGSLTLEEAAKAISLAEKLGTRFVAPLPAEDMAIAPFKNNFSFDNIAEAATNIVVGDAFTLCPTIAKLLHDASALDRRNTMIAIDTVHSRTGWFAHPELIAPVGRVPMLLDALAAAIEGKGELPPQLGIDADDFARAVGSIKAASGKGNIVVTPGWHFVDPFAVASAAQRLAEIAGFGFAALPIATNSRGIYRLLAAADCDIAGTFEALSSGRIDALLALDCDPVEGLPGIEIPKVFGLTGQLRTDGYDAATHFVPSTYLFEKAGHLLGTEEGIVTLEGGIDGPGVQGAGEIVDTIYGGKAPVPEDIERRATELIEVGSSPIANSGTPPGEVIAFGEGNVLHHGDGRYTRRMDFPFLRAKLGLTAAKLPKALAGRLGVAEGDKITITSDRGSAELDVEIAPWIDDGTVLLPMHNPAARGLFDWGKSPLLGPIAVGIKKA